MHDEYKFCYNCGVQIDVKAEICPSCGVIQPILPQVHSVYQIKKKSPGTAAILSFILVGLGQIYVGKIGRGLGFLVFGAVIGFFASFAYGDIMMLIMAIGVWIVSAFDAYALAKKYNNYYEVHGQPPW